MIALCGNGTGFDGETLIEGGQSDRYLSPILRHLPDSARIVRQPVAGAVCALTNHWTIYAPGAWRRPAASVLISHGIGDKGYRDKSHAAQYDLTTFPGPALADLALRGGVPAEKIRICGYPKLDPIYRGEVSSPWPARDGRTRVLWAPTHGGGSERWSRGNRRAPGAGATTWWQRDELLGLLDPERHLVVEAPHPRHSPGRQATLAEYVGADVVLADGGSTMYEAWCVGLPVVFADWLTARRNLTRDCGKLLEHRVYADRIGWHADGPHVLESTVDMAAAAGITPAEVSFSREVLPPDLRGHGGRLHAELLMEVERGRVGSRRRSAGGVGAAARQADGRAYPPAMHAARPQDQPSRAPVGDRATGG
jgi:hypothetical protein